MMRSPAGLRAGKLRDRGQQIDGHRRRARVRAFRDATRPARDERHADAALECRPLALAEVPGRAGVIAVGQPRTVVGGEDHQRVVVEAGALHRVEDLPDGPVDLRDDVAVEPPAGLAP